MSNKPKNILREALGEVTLDDLDLLIEYAPRIVAWFRARRRDRRAIESDFRRITSDLDETRKDAVRRLDERLPDHGARDE